MIKILVQKLEEINLEIFLNENENNHTYFIKASTIDLGNLKTSVGNITIK